MEASDVVLGATAVPNDELEALREQAASAIPWKSEAYRLAEALYVARPNHPIFEGEIWQEFIKAKQEAVENDWGHEPEDISEALR